MAHFQTYDLEYADGYYSTSDFEENFFSDDTSPKSSSKDSFDSDFEDDFDTQVKSKTDTTAMDVRNGKDIQGIPWERMNFTRSKYRETRLLQYKNYESLSSSREDLEKDCKQVEKNSTFYNFQFNTRLVKSTIVHFQVETCHLPVTLKIFQSLHECCIRSQVLKKIHLCCLLFFFFFFLSNHHSFIQLHHSSMHFGFSIALPFPLRKCISMDVFQILHTELYQSSNFKCSG